MILSYDSQTSRFVLRTSYHDFQDHAEKIKGARFRWDPQSKTWWTSSPENAAMLISCADDTARGMLHNLAHQAQAALAASRAEDAELKHDLLRDPYPFQRAGIVYCLEHDRVLVADDPGLGKTLQALGAIHLRAAYPAIAVVPASLKLNWLREAQKTCQELIPPEAVTIISGRPKADAQAMIAALNGSTKLWIINYDIVADWLDILSAIPFRAWIADESHFLKNPEARRTKACKKLVEGIQIRYELTGTPILNRTKELASQLDILGAIDDFGGTWSYLMRYADGHREPIWTKIGGRAMKKMIWNFDGASNLDELQRKLRSRWMVRRSKDAVLKDLPPKRHQIIEFPANGLQNFVDDEISAEALWQERIDQARLEQDWSRIHDDHATFDLAAEMLRKYYPAYFSEMAALRHKTALAKLPKCIEHHIESLEEVGKLVIFAHHHDVVNGLMAALKDYAPVKLTGEETKERKQKAVDAFQDGDARVFIGSIKAAGVGINLFKAALCQFDELDWTPGWMDQASDRLHRIGQLDSVLIQYLVLENSLDCKMVGMLIEKAKVARAAMDGPLRDYLIPPEEPEESKKHGDPADLPEAIVAAIHLGLRILAGTCDGAKARDGHGFNKLDSRFGRALAQCPGLTPRQAHFAKRMLKKYHHQLDRELVLAIWPNFYESNQEE